MSCAALTVFTEPFQTFFASDSFRKLMLDPTSDSEYEGNTPYCWLAARGSYPW